MKTTERNACRPFDFLVAFWGQRFTKYFMDLCLPSLLAPNNIPLLRHEDGHRFLVATTRKDWATMERLPIMDRLRAHVTPTLVEIGPGPSSPTAAEAGALSQYTSVIRHQTLSLKRLFDEAYRHRSMGCLLFPDTMYSNGSVETIIGYAEAGYQFVLGPALRQKEEAIRADLDRLGYLKQDEEPSLTARSIDVPARVAADLFVRHLHPEMAPFEFASPKPTRPFISPFCYHRVSGGRGLLLYSFFGSPVIMDFASLKPDHSECLEQDGYDSVYLDKNLFRDYTGQIAFIRDSDEFVSISVTPEAADFSASTPHARPRPAWKRAYAQLCDIRDSMRFYVGRNWAPIRRDLVMEPFRIHSGDFDDVWAQEERKAARTISLVVGDYRHATRAPTLAGLHAFMQSGPRMMAFETSGSGAFTAGIAHRAPRLQAAMSRARSGLVVFSTVGSRVSRALMGDAGARAWLSWRTRKAVAALTNQPFEERPPPPPA